MTVVGVIDGVTDDKAGAKVVGTVVVVVTRVLGVEVVTTARR